MAIAFSNDPYQIGASSSWCKGYSVRANIAMNYGYAYGFANPANTLNLAVTHNTSTEQKL